MPRLLLLRHAKSVPADPGAVDIERPLALRGRRASGLVGEHLARHHLLPDRVLCSSSKRTRETLAGLLSFLDGEVAVRITGALYQPPSGTYAECISRHGEDSATLLVIGHNPAIQETATLLIGSGNEASRREIAAAFPTAGLAVIDFDPPWNRLARGSGRIVAFFRPRDLELVDGKAAPGDDD